MVACKYFCTKFCIVSNCFKLDLSTKVQKQCRKHQKMAITGPGGKGQCPSRNRNRSRKGRPSKSAVLTSYTLVPLFEFLNFTELMLMSTINSIELQNPT